MDGGSDTAIYSNSTSESGVYGVSGTNAAVYGYSTSDYGVDGRSLSSIGVYGQSYSSGGMWGLGPYIGVQGNSTGTDINRQAIRGDNNGSATGYAGLFYGNTWVTGTLFKNAGGFKIDHPLDPIERIPGSLVCRIAGHEEYLRWRGDHRCQGFATGDSSPITSKRSTAIFATS